MPDFEIRYLLLGVLAIALLVAAATDIRRREIDNWLTGALVLAAPAYWWASGFSLYPDIAWQLGVATATFAVLLALFALRAMGGGDVKLLTALALWIAPLDFLRLVVVMSLIGGVLTALLWAWHRWRHREGRPLIPYGVAISLAGLWVLTTQFASLIDPPGPAAGLG